MSSPYITAVDLDDCSMVADVRLYAGRGWLPLVHEALPVIKSSKIMAIREDAGALRIELVYSTNEQLAALREIEEKSLQVCEICGGSGELRFDGFMDGRPAGWH